MVIVLVYIVLDGAYGICFWSCFKSKLNYIIEFQAIIKQNCFFPQTAVTTP